MEGSARVSLVGRLSRIGGYDLTSATRSRAPTGVKETPRTEMTLQERKSASGYKIDTQEVTLSSPGQSEMEGMRVPRGFAKPAGRKCQDVMVNDRSGSVYQ